MCIRDARGGGRSRGRHLEGREGLRLRPLDPGPTHAASQQGDLEHRVRLADQQGLHQRHAGVDHRAMTLTAVGAFSFTNAPLTVAGALFFISAA